MGTLVVSRKRTIVEGTDARHEGATTYYACGPQRDCFEAAMEDALSFENGDSLKVSQEACGRVDKLEAEVQRLRDTLDNYDHQLEGKAIGWWKEQNRKLEAEVQRLSALLAAARNHNDYSARSCPLCEYREGALIGICGYHQELQRLRAELVQYKSNDAIVAKARRLLDEMERDGEGDDSDDEVEKLEAKVRRLTTILRMREEDLGALQSRYAQDTKRLRVNLKQLQETAWFEKAMRDKAEEKNRKLVEALKRLEWVSAQEGQEWAHQYCPACGADLAGDKDALGGPHGYHKPDCWLGALLQEIEGERKAR